MRLPDEWLFGHCGNEISPDALKVLTDSGPDDNLCPDHVFTGLLECLPQDHRDRLLSMRPPKRASRSAAAACYSAQRAYMTALESELFTAGASAKCCKLHPGESCPLFWSPSMSMDNEQTRPLKMNFSGPMCTPWTSQGPQLGDADPAMESWNCWIKKMKHSELDLIFMENSARFPFALFADELSQVGYLCIYVIFDAQDLSICDPKPLTLNPKP